MMEDTVIRYAVRFRMNLFAKQIITPAGEVVLDFGQNIVGYVSLNVRTGKRVDESMQKI